MNAPALAFPASDIAHCRSVLDASRSSFRVAIRFLPREARHAMTAFYAFCRDTDDAVDLAPDRLSATKELRIRAENLQAAFEGKPRESIGRALFWAHRRFGLEKKHLDLIVEGCGYDLERNRYATFSDLYEYCYRVASAVGLAVVTVTRGREQRLDGYAELTGIAVQMTNIIRDVGDDAKKGRIYLPREELRAFGVTESDLFAGNDSPAFRALLAFQTERTKEFYRIAQAALPSEEKGPLFFAEAVRETYARLLDVIEKQKYPVLHRVVRLSAGTKTTIAAKHFLRPFLGLRRFSRSSS